MLWLTCENRSSR